MDRPTAPFAPGKIFPPLPRDATPFRAASRDRSRLDLRSGALVLVSGVVATVIGAFAIATLAQLTARALGASAAVQLQYAQACALLGGTLYGIAWTLRGLREHATTALTDRGTRGCAWYGASDEVVAHAFLLGGVLNLFALLCLPQGFAEELARTSGQQPFARWDTSAAMIFAFASIAARPVLEELLFRGVLFGTLSAVLGRVAAAIAVTVAFVLAHQAQLVLHPPTLLWIGAMGALAMHLRLKHASLAPAIALHSGFNFLPMIYATLA